MFDRKKYKANAIAQLKNHWLNSCLITAVIFVILGVSVAGSPILFFGVCGIFSVAFIRSYIKQIELSESISFSSFLESLGTHWLPSLTGALWCLLWCFLWSFLFFFPAIIKFYSYSMMFFIIAENPKIGAEKAMNLSKILTAGHKSDLFLMHLSFLGWIFLCCITGGTGFIALVPYIQMTNLNAYYDLKQMALTARILSPADFN